MRRIALVQLDKRRPALILTRSSKIDRMTSVTVAPITTVIRDLPSEVHVGLRNGLDQSSVISCDNITTVPKTAIGRSIGLLLESQELELARAISDAFELEVP